LYLSGSVIFSIKYVEIIATVVAKNVINDKINGNILFVHNQSLALLNSDTTLIFITHEAANIIIRIIRLPINQAINHPRELVNIS
jgi:hypothetical protein